MAGLWERVRPDALSRIDMHLIIAAMRAYHVNTVDASKGATRLQIRDGLNQILAEENAPLLSAAEEADLTAIADAFDAQTNQINKLIFISGLEYVMIAAEKGVIGEAKWRNDLGI